VRNSSEHREVSVARKGGSVKQGCVKLESRNLDGRESRLTAKFGPRPIFLQVSSDIHGRNRGDFMVVGCSDSTLLELEQSTETVIRSLRDSQPRWVQTEGYLVTRLQRLAKGTKMKT
jgi:hypothetical protein